VLGNPSVTIKNYYGPQEVVHVELNNEEETCQFTDFVYQTTMQVRNTLLAL